MSKQEIESTLSVIFLTLLLFALTVASWVSFLTDLNQLYLELLAGKPCPEMTKLDLWLSNSVWTHENLACLLTNIVASLLCVMTAYIDYRLFCQNFQIVRRHSWR